MSNWIVTQIELTGTREILEKISKAINQCNDGKGLVGQLPYQPFFSITQRLRLFTRLMEHQAQE